VIAIPGKGAFALYSTIFLSSVRGGSVVVTRGIFSDGCLIAPKYFPT
jgi:hypothetical protein